MIHGETRVALALRWIVVSLFSLFAMMTPVGVVAQWDQLSPQQQQQVLDDLKTRLSGILAPGPARDDLDYMLTYGRGWSQLAGSLSDGDYDQAIRSTIELGEGHLKKSLEDELNLQVASTGLSETTQGMYGYVMKNKLLAKQLAIAMFQGKWDGARKLVWEQAKKDAAAAAEANFAAAYNWVFDNRSVGAVTPAAAFLYVVRAEMELIPRWAAAAEDAKLQEIFTKYRELGRDWESFQAELSDVGYTTKFRGGFATWDFKPGEMQALFESCRREFITHCINDAKMKIKREREAVARSLKKIGQQRSDRLHTELEKLSKEINRLSAEFDEKFKNAFSEAQSIATQIKSLAGSVSVQCAAFKAAVEKAEAALQKVRDAEASVATVQGFISKGEDCVSLEEDFKKLSGDLDRLKNLKTDFDTSLSQVETASREVCAASDGVWRAASRTAGRTALDTAVQRARYLQTLVRAVEDTAASIRSGNAEMATEVKDKKAQLEQLTSSVSDTTAAEAAFTAIEVAEDAKQEFDTARAAMEHAVKLLDSLTAEFDRVNPVVPGLMDRVTGLLRGGYNKDEKRKMLNLLRKYRDYPGVDELLVIHADALKTMACADTVHRQWDSSGSRTGRWSFRQWREPNIPANLRNDYQQALRQCADLPASSELDDIAEQASRLTEQMELREVELWLHKNDADECVAVAIAMYDLLPGDQVDTSATGLIEAAERKIATAQASGTTFKEVKGKLEAAGSKYTAQLGSLREGPVWWQGANTRMGRGVDRLKQEMARTRQEMQNIQNAYGRLADAGPNLRQLAGEVCAVSTAPQDRITAWRSKLQDLTAEVGAIATDTETQYLERLLDRVKTERQNLKGETQAARLQYIVIEGKGNKAVKAASNVLTHREKLRALNEEIASLKTEALGLLDQAEAALPNGAPDQRANLANRIQTARANANALGTGLRVPSYVALGMDTVPEPNALRAQVGRLLSMIDTRLDEVDKLIAEAEALPGEAEGIRVAGEFATRTVPEHLARATTCLAGITPETRTVTVEDSTGPSLSNVPADITAEATSAAGAAVSYSSPTASDDVDPTPSVSCSPASGSTFALGSTSVTCVTTDASGNSSDASFTVTIQDTTPPTLETLAGIRAEATSTSGAAGSYPLPTASDVVDPAPSVSCSPASGSIFPIGSTPVTCVATDASGNSSDTGFMVTIVEGTSTQPPTGTGRDTTRRGDCDPTDSRDDCYDPTADIGGMPEVSEDQVRQAAAAAEAAQAAGWAGEAVGSASSGVPEGVAPIAIDCEYTGTCPESAETAASSGGEEEISVAGRDGVVDDIAEQYGTATLPTWPSHPAQPAPTTSAVPGHPASTAPAEPPKDQRKRAPTQPEQPSPPQPRQDVSCCALTGDISVPDQRYIVSTSTRSASRGGVQGNPECTRLTLVDVISIDAKNANDAASGLRSRGNQQVQIFTSESAALSRANALCRKPVWDNMVRPIQKPKDGQGCAELKAWWQRARCDENLLRDPRNLSRSSGPGYAAYLACKNALSRKNQCASSGQW